MAAPQSGRTPLTDTRRAGFPNPFSQIPVENRLPLVQAVLANKQLAGSFIAHLKDQLQRDGTIRIAVVDDFSAGQTHGVNVETRILANVPDHLRDRVRIVRYDMGGKGQAGRAQVLQRVADAAQRKEVVAVSISGGLQAYPVERIERASGQPLSKASAARAFDATARQSGMAGAERAAWAALAQASKRIPVVTPVWNDGNTTLAALMLAGSNGIVTTIDPSQASRATKTPLADVRMPDPWKSGTTSQSAPTFIGQSLGLLDESSARRSIRPVPRDSGYGNGGRPQ